jgi:hypothetical protein
MQRDCIYQERRPQQGEVRIERLAQNQLVRKLRMGLRFAEEPFQALPTPWTFEPLHLGPEFSSVGGESDGFAVVVVDDVVGFAFDQVEMGGKGGGEVCVDVPEEGGQEEERGALRD